MRKIVCFLILACVASCFAGCGNTTRWEPERVSDDLIPYVERTIEIIDGYLNFEIPADEATTQIGEVSNRMGAESIADFDNNYPFVERHCASYITRWEKFGIDSDSDIELRAARDVLLYAIGNPVSGERDYHSSDSAADLMQHYDYMCGYNPEDMAGIAMEIYDAIVSDESEYDVAYQSYMCYEQYVFMVTHSYADGEYRIEIIGEGSLDGIIYGLYENVSVADMESAILEAASYFTEP